MTKKSTNQPPCPFKVIAGLNNKSGKKIFGVFKITPNGTEAKWTMSFDEAKWLVDAIQKALNSQDT